MIVAPSADLDLALRAICFAAVGTAGQRCTSLRRLIVHEDVYGRLLPKLKRAYGSVKVGDPRDGKTLVGPLIDRGAFEKMQSALKQAAEDGGKVTGGERLLSRRHPDAFYVRPAIVEMPKQSEIVREETFAPILYVMKYRDFDQALAHAQRRAAGPCLLRSSPPIYARRRRSCRLAAAIAASSM